MRTSFSLSAGAIYVACEYFEIRCCDGTGALNCSPATLPNFGDLRWIAPSGTEQAALRFK
ncbi:hypothetical protein AWB69_09045 [Caballeronia udeis]|uniref:Uncharacterized protein n=1 Tax=Caballeronia udeis TaxID=1232866 RepID=A0A158JY16_9BURK|nr:hypothetical protein AWB69_09045 [Caballeronia udeis]